MSHQHHVELLFRHEYGKLVSLLSNRVGTHRIEDVEDAVQFALQQALATWPAKGVPKNQTAWLYHVAKNKLLETLRQQSGRERILDKAFELESTPEDQPTLFLPGEIRDDMLRMLFICCNDAIPIESQLVLALKILCGFDVREIALRLFATESKIYKRLQRARNSLKELPFAEEDLTGDKFKQRLPTLHQVLYLLFTEGHLSSHADYAIRAELCQEALRLANILREHPLGRTPETLALLALMHLHMARLSSRQDATGGLLLLEEQDRTSWDKEQIKAGLKLLGDSANGNNFSRYHAEAGIAAEHCLAPSFSKTRWEQVASNYELLETIAPSALHKLNRAIAVAEWQGPAKGLALLENFEPPTWLSGSYAWSAVLADLNLRCGNRETANRYRNTAISTAPSESIKQLLERRLKIP